MEESIQKSSITEPISQPRYSWKFYTGIFLIVLSLILGKITQLIFFIYLDDSWLMWSSLIIYILSWPMMVIGIWWVGKEYADKIRKYADYKYYHQSLREGTRRVVEKTKQFHHQTQMIREKVRKHFKKVGRLKRKK